MITRKKDPLTLSKGTLICMSPYLYKKEIYYAKITIIKQKSKKSSTSEKQVMKETRQNLIKILNN